VSSASGDAWHLAAAGITITKVALVDGVHRHFGLAGGMKVRAAV
jgi:hypothetical protein